MNQQTIRTIRNIAILFAIGFAVAHTVLGNNIAALQQQIPVESFQLMPDGSETTSERLAAQIESAYAFFYATFGAFAVSGLLFSTLVYRVVYVHRREDQTEGLMIVMDHVRLLLYALMGLMIMGYCLQLSLIDPLQGAQEIFGQPYVFDFSFERASSLKFPFTNPFVNPTMGLMTASALMVLLVKSPMFSWLNGKMNEYQRNRQATALIPQSMEDNQQQMNLWIYKVLFGVALVCFLGLLLLPSAFLGGVTLIEVPKIVLIIAMAGTITEMARVRLKTIKEHVAASKILTVVKPIVNLLSVLPFMSKEPWTTEREYEVVQATKVLLWGVVGLITSGGLFYALNDLGATLIVLFAFVLINAATALKNSLWKMGLVFYGVLMAMKQFGASRVQVSEERINDWLLSDHFVASGIGDAYLPGTSSSPDFAKSLWGIASGSWFGRWTGLFVDQFNEIYAASMAFAYNDRALAGVIEVFGVLGLVVLIVFYGLLVNACLVISLVPQRSNVTGFGVSLGLAALIFGQTAVHMGGNLGFIPFTGIVLPFVSHSGLASVFSLWVIAIMIVLYSPSVGMVSLNPPAKAEQERLKGMQNFIAMTYLIILVAGVKLTIWDGPSNATRIRYDVQSDLNVKRRVNPRFFLLTHRMTAQGQIQDVNGQLIRNAEGEYLFDSVDNSDVFVHRFEQAHRMDLKGINTQALEGERYFEQVCVLKDGAYHQFAGRTIQDAQAEIKSLTDSLGPEVDFDCTVVKSHNGDLIQRREVGVPVDPYDPEAGCSVEGEVFVPSPERSVWYFDVTQSTRLTGYLTDPENPVPISLSASDMVGHVFGLFGRTEATSCVVHEWRLNTERRTGVLDGEECVVSDSMDGDSVVYGEDEINGDALGGYSARRIRIEPHVDGTCEAQIDRVACRLDGVNWVDQHQPDLTAELNSIEILYGRNAKLSFSDDNCQVVFHELGHLKQHPSEKSTALKRYHFREKSIGELTTKFEDVIDLVDYVRADASRQQDMMTQLSQRVPEVMTTMGLDAALQSDVRQIVDKYQRAYQSPSVQALVFRVDSGEILAQAQATQVRDNLKEAAQSGDYDSLYTDFGMYGYGRNNLASDMVPASTFKILHGLAAIEVGHVDFTHKCDTQVGYLPEDNAWVTPKPIEDYGANSVGYSSHNNTSKGTTMSHAIYKSCNQYFAALADTHTHPDALVGLCRDKGLRFSGSDACSLKPAGTRGAASNGYGQELTMNVYQLANMLIATATNYQPYLEYWDVYLTPEVRLEQTASSYRPLFVEQEKVDNIGTHILSGMRTKASPLTKRLNKDTSKTPLRVYGKTGTGDHLISTRTYTTEKVGDYIVPQKRRGKQVWEENYEAPYGVKSTRRKGVLKGSNMSIYVALVEQASQEPDQVHGQRIGVVVRIPRVGQKPSNCRYGITASCIAEPVAEDLITTIREHGLIPE